MKIELNSNGVGQVYFPKSLRKVWGEAYDMVPNDVAGCIYPRGANLGHVIESLRIVLQDLENRAKRTRKAVLPGNETLGGGLSASQRRRKMGIFPDREPHYVNWLAWCWKKPVYIGFPLAIGILFIVFVDLFYLVFWWIKHWGK